MGKGGGCVPSKSRVGASDSPPNPAEGPVEAPEAPAAIAQENPQPEPPAQATATASSSSAPVVPKLKIFIVYYSMYGNVEALAERVKQGVDFVKGVEGVLYRVPETLPDEVLREMMVPMKNQAVPVIRPEELAAADGILFGFPTRHGAMAAQMKAFFDSTGSLWREQKLAGKPAGFFVSTGILGGGQETTAWTAITQLAHHAMPYVPMGCAFEAALLSMPGMFKMDSVTGVSPFGAGTYCGEPTETELFLAEHQGKYMASLVKRLAVKS